jgi:exodeoxyribonuclease X
MNLLFFDTETTGLEEDAKIIQIACNFYETEKKVFGRYSLETINKFFDPGKKIGVGAMASHHIRQEQVDGQPLFSTMIPFLNEVSSKYVFVAHNAVFDIKRLTFEGVSDIPFYIDTLKVATVLLQEQEEVPESYSLQYLRYFLDLEKGETQREIIGGNVISPHDAYSDILILECLFFFLFQRFSEQNESLSEREILSQMVNISKNPVLLKRIGFGKSKGFLFSQLETDYLSYFLKKIKEEPSGFSEDFQHTVKDELTKRGFLKS